jgi:hypothetical protein
MKDDLCACFYMCDFVSFDSDGRLCACFYVCDFVSFQGVN